MVESGEQGEAFPRCRNPFKPGFGELRRADHIGRALGEEQGRGISDGGGAFPDGFAMANQIRPETEADVVVAMGEAFFELLGGAGDAEALGWADPGVDGEPRQESRDDRCGGHLEG